MLTFIRLQTATVPNFRFVYVHATSTLSSSLLSPLGINVMGLLLGSMCLAPTGQMGKMQIIDTDQGVREEGELSQRTRRDRYSGKTKEEMVSSEEPRAEQETAYSHCR